MSIIEAIILGLVQGLTEFIPVSSSGHLLLAHEVFDTSDYTLAFDVALHVGTLAALVVYFRRDILELLLNVAKPTKQGRLARTLALATLPAVVAGLLFEDYIEEHLRSPLIVAVMLVVVGVAMLLVEQRATSKKSHAEVTTKQGLIIGAMQALALIPGVSRSGITMTTGMFIGLDRVGAARFSFLLAMPIIAGSAAGSLFDDSGFSVIDPTVLVGIAVSFVSGMFAIRFLLSVIAKVGLRYFAYYRIALAAIVVLLSLL